MVRAHDHVEYSGPIRLRAIFASARCSMMADPATTDSRSIIPDDQVRDYIRYLNTINTFEGQRRDTPASV